MSEEKPESASSIESGLFPDKAGRTPWWMFPNVLSLDAPVVAVVWAWFFARSYSKGLVTGDIYLVLAITVWLIYTADRLFDASRVRDHSMATDRHRFHRRFFRPMAAIFVCLFAVDVWLVLYRLPSGMLYFRTGMEGALRPRMEVLVLIILVAIYLVYVARRRGLILSIIPKEIFCGFVFAGGVAFPALWHAQERIPFFLMIPTVFGFALLCSLNCILIACWEWKADHANDPTAITQTRSGAADLIKPLGIIIIVMAGLFGVFSMMVDDVEVGSWMTMLGPLNLGSNLAPVFFATSLSGVLLLLLHSQREKISLRGRRLLADGVLLTPLVLSPFFPGFSLF